MIDQVVDAPSPTPRVPLAAALIGMLLVLWGFIALVGGGLFLMKLPMLMKYLHQPAMQHPGLGAAMPVSPAQIIMICVSNGLDVLFGLLGLVAGVALLLGARWALKGTRAILLITIIGKVLFVLGWQILRPLFITLQAPNGWQSPYVQSYLFAVVLFLVNLVPYIVFYAVLKRGDDEHNRRSSVPALVAALLFSWMGAWLTSVSSNIAAIFQNPHYPAKMITLQEMAAAICVLAIAAGIGLLRRASWARPLAIAMLLAGMLLIAPYQLVAQWVLMGSAFFSGMSRMLGGGPQTIAFIAAMFNTLAGMLVYLATMIILLRDRPEAAAVEDAELAEPAVVVG